MLTANKPAVAAGSLGRLSIWPLWLRLLHWGLVSAVLLGWLSGFALFGLLPWHELAGYAALALVALRGLGGYLGRGYARWSQFVLGARATGAYWRQLRQGQAPRYLGHNPLGGWMIVALLACISALGLTGFLATTDLFWGYAWLARLHLALAWLLMGLVALHLSGVLAMSWRHRENLVAAMVTGRKKALAEPAPGEPA